MALRSVFAFDSDSLVVTSSSNGSLIGNGIINNSNTPDDTTFVYNGGSGATVTLDDTANRGRFDDGRPDDHIITDGGGLVANGTPVESESRIFLRELDSNGVPTGPQITVTVFSQNGVTSDVWGFGTSQVLTPGASYIKVGGNNNGNSPYSQFITCFGPGTPIRTPEGAVPVERLRRGQPIWTLHDGPVPIRWIASTDVAGTGPFAPVVLEKGAVGNRRELVVSQEHRMFFRGDLAALLFGEPEILIAAKFLCGLPGVTIRERARIRYTHFMCDRHVIVRAAGALSESFFFSKNALDGMEAGARRELSALFPTLTQDADAFGPTAARVLNAAEAAAFRASL
ncbi:MAG: Hint domain-containing protein [Pseudomonadota bacterium]